MKRLLMIPAVLLLAACPDEPPPVEPDDMGGSINQFTVQPDAPPPRQWTAVRVDDDTPTGQGLPLDAVEVCDLLGANCVALELESSSDETLDYAGAHDGPNSQDDTCTDMTFTRLGGTGNFVVFALPDGAAIARGSRINVWTATSACPLVEVGDKAFFVTVVDAEGEEPVEACLGTCTVIAP